MAPTNHPTLSEIIKTRHAELLAGWLSEMAEGAFRSNLLREGQLRDQCSNVLQLLAESTRSGANVDLEASEWEELRRMLDELSRSRGRQGFSPSETAIFVLSLKVPLFAILRRELAGDSDALFTEILKITQMLDRLALLTIETHAKGREEVISRQQQEMLELSTPVVRLWEGVLALPVIGTLDSARTQVMMETLLQTIVETGSQIAIIDITGVPTVDTLVAQHLMKTVAAARLMGADCIISGIRPQIAQTIVHLGVDLSAVTTKANMADAFALALRRSGATLSRSSAATLEK